MMPHNYTQDREELNIRFFDDNVNIHNVTICGHRFIELVNVTLEVLNQYKDLRISFGPKMLYQLLSGEHSKMIDQFKMYNNKWFGYLSADDKGKFYSVFSALKEARIIDVNEKDYGRTTVLRDKLREEDFKMIFALIKNQ